jgi:NAD+ kinase
VRARTVTLLSHARTEQVAPAVTALVEAARAEGVTLRFDPDETAKHGLEAGEGIELDAPVSDDVELCVVLGGDGTILRALRRYAGTSVPVFAVNYGEIGFLATIDPHEDSLADGMARALAGDFETLTLPALAVETPDGPHAAINDFAIHRRQGTRVAQLSYAAGGEEVGSVRCDGLVLATPAGSTGYNLANGGPVMAWGVEGFAVSFISPHSLTARALVVARDVRPLQPLADRHPPSPRLVGQAPRPHDREVQAARRQRRVRVRLRLEVRPHLLGAGARVVGADRAHHQVPPHAGRLRRLDQLHGSGVVDRPLALGPAARPRARGEHHRVRTGDARGDVVERLEIRHHRLRSDVRDAGRVVRVADQRPHAVPARAQQPRQPQRDLPVPSGDDDLHDRRAYVASRPNFSRSRR